MEMAGETRVAKEGDFLEKAIDKAFSLRKETWFLIGIIALAFILRLMFAMNTSVTADNMVHGLHAINFLESGKLIDYSQSAALWHKFTDSVYGAIGVGQLGARTAALLFGTLSVLAIYLLCGRFFSQRVALISAFVMAIAPFHLRNTDTEMDVMVMFFMLMAMYFFVKGTEGEKRKDFALGGVFMGLALYTKVYVVLFLISLLLYYLYVLKKSGKKLWTKEHLWQLGLFLCIAFIFTIPTLTHNYLLYKDKGFVDLQFTGALDIGKDKSAQYFGWDGSFNATSNWKSLILGHSEHSEGWSTKPTLLLTLGFILKASPLIFILGIVGLVWILVQKKEDKGYTILFSLSIVFLWVYLSTVFLLSKHYLFIEMLLVPLASFSINELEQGSRKFGGKRTLAIILGIALLATLWMMGGGAQPYGKSAVSKMIDFKESIPHDAVIIADSRIYRGQIYWMLYGKQYLEALEFAQLMSHQDQMKGPVVSVNVYYIECVTDDCGWGTIASQPDLNDTMEQITSLFKNMSSVSASIDEPRPDRKYYPFISRQNRREVYRVYTTTIPLHSDVVAYAQQQRSWFLYPIGHPHPESEFDAYTPQTNTDVMLNDLAHLIAWVALILAWLSIPFVVYTASKNLGEN